MGKQTLSSSSKSASSTPKYYVAIADFKPESEAELKLSLGEVVRLYDSKGDSHVAAAAKEGWILCEQPRHPWGIGYMAQKGIGYVPKSWLKPIHADQALQAMRATVTLSTKVSTTTTSADRQRSSTAAVTATTGRRRKSSSQTLQSNEKIIIAADDPALLQTAVTLRRISKPENSNNNSLIWNDGMGVDDVQTSSKPAKDDDFHFMSRYLASSKTAYDPAPKGLAAIVNENDYLKLANVNEEYFDHVKTQMRKSQTSLRSIVQGLGGRLDQADAKMSDLISAISTLEKQVEEEKKKCKTELLGIITHTQQSAT